MANLTRGDSLKLSALASASGNFGNAKMSVIAGSSATPISMSAFAIDSVDGISGFTYVVEQTFDSYELTMTGKGGRFDRIDLAQNFTWNVQASGSYTGSSYITITGSASSSAQIFVSEMNPQDPSAQTEAMRQKEHYISASFADGFNDHATGYNTVFGKTIYSVDTYNSNTLLCLTSDTPITLYDGTEVEIGDLFEGDELLGYAIDGLGDYEYDYLGWDTTSLKLTPTPVIVKSVTYSFSNKIYNINNGELRATFEHPLLIKDYTDGKYRFKEVGLLTKKDKLVKQDILADITSITVETGNDVEIVSIDVETQDTFVVNGYINHNKGGNEHTDLAVFDPATEAFITAVEATGSTLTSTEKNAIDALVSGLKSGSIWDSFHAIYPLVGDEPGTQKWNLKNPDDTDAAFRLTFNGTITHSNNGIQSNGTSGWANTHLVPSTTMSITDQSLHVSTLGNASQVQSDCHDIGSYTGASQNFYIQAKHSNESSSLFIRMNAGITEYPNPNPEGHYTITRGSGNVFHYKNGTEVGNVAHSGTLPDKIVALCNTGFGSTVYSVGYSNQIIGFAAIGKNLTSSSVATFHSLIDDYYVAIGRGNPIEQIGGLIHWWHEEDIPGTTAGDSVTSWTDWTGSYELTTYATAPTLNLTSGRSIKFNDNGGLGAAETASIDFNPDDPFTFVVKLGPLPGTDGTLVSKAETGTDPIHYQVQLNDAVDGNIGLNIFKPSTLLGFANFSEDGTAAALSPHSAEDVIIYANGSGSTNINVYRNTTEFGIFVSSSNGPKGDYTGSEDFRIGCRGDGLGGAGFTYDGTIRHVLVFNKKLTTGEISTVVSHL